MKWHSFIGTMGLAALAVVSQAQLDKSVSFSAPAMEPKKLLAELSKTAGLELDAAGDFVDEPLIISVKDVKVQDLLDRIATVLHGKWTDTSSGKRLERDKDAVRALESAKAARRLKGYEDAIKAYLERRAADAKWDTDQVAKLIEKERKEREQLLANVRSNNPDLGNSTISIMKGSSNSVSPASPALLEALRKLPVSAFAAVGPGQRVVYAMTPTNVQKRLPFAANNIVDTFSRAHDALVRALSGGPADPPNVTVIGGLDLNAKPLQGPVQEVLLILTRRGNGEGVSVDLKLADGTGTYVGMASAWIAPKIEPAAPSTAEIKASGPVALSPLAKQLAVNFLVTSGEGGGGQNTFAISSRGGGGVFRISSDSPTAATTPVLSKEALAALADPVRIDPQATFVSEGLTALAEAADIDLVASLPDRAVLPLARTLAKEAKLDTLVAAMTGAGVALTRNGDWATLTAKDWLSSRTTQMRRSGAKSLYGAVVAKGYARLQELAKFSISLGSTPDSDNFGIVTLRAIEPFVAEELSFPIQEKPALFQLLGTLDSRVFDDPRPETVFRIGSMSQAQLGLLERTVYSSSGPSIMGDGDFIGIGISTGDGPEPEVPHADGLHSEPTEIYAQGLPALGEVRLRFTIQDSVYASVKGSRGGRFMTAEGLGHMEAMADGQTIPELQSRAVKFDRFRPSKSNFINLQVQFGEKAVTSGDYSDWVLPDTTTTGTYDDLPQAFRDEVAKAKAQMREGRVSFGPGGRKPPL